MTEFKGTPGPWVISFRRDEVNIPIRGPHFVTATYAGNEDNARLIAAAPDLLEVLEAIVAETTVGKKGSCVTRSKYVSYSAARFHEARAAIAKALGQ